jgi:hypothetical protein
MQVKSIRLNNGMHRMQGLGVFPMRANLKKNPETLPALHDVHGLDHWTARG